MSPFMAGGEAYRRGEHITDNPHTEKMESGDRYPGDWANWRAGWRNAKATTEFDKEKAQ